MSRTEHLKAELLELDRQQKQGLLVPVAEVRLKWIEVITMARTKLMGLPTKAKQRIPELDVTAKILNHIVGYHIHQDPCPIMLVQPTEADAQSYSKEEISPMIRDTPVLNKLISEAKTRDSNNTILQ